MDPEHETTTFFEIFETLISHGKEELGEIMRLLLNLAMKIERNHFLKADPYERNSERMGYANGYKPKHSIPA